MFAELYHSLIPEQKQEICFPWDHATDGGIPWRQRLSNHWQVTRPSVLSDFYTPVQQGLILSTLAHPMPSGFVDVLIQHALHDTRSPFGSHYSIALLGTPESDHELLLTGRHLNLHIRNGRIANGAFLGHARPLPLSDFTSAAILARTLYAQLNPHQQSAALSSELPAEADFGKRPFPGVEIENGLQFISQLIPLHLPKFEIPAQPQTFGVYGDPRSPWFEAFWLSGGDVSIYFHGTPHVHIWLRWGDDPCCVLPGVFLHPEHDPLR